MADVDDGDIVRVTAKLKFADVNEVQNVFHFKCANGLGTTGLDFMEASARLLDGMYDHIAPYMVGAVTFDTVAGFNVTKDTPLPDVPWPTQTAGTGGTGTTPTGVAALALLRTGLNRVLGKKYLGPFLASLLTGGRWNSTLTGAIALFAVSLLDRYIDLTNGVEMDPGVKTKSGAFRVFTDVVTTDNPVYQRRRREGRGA